MLGLEWPMTMQVIWNNVENKFSYTEHINWKLCIQSASFSITNLNKLYKYPLKLALSGKLVKKFLGSSKVLFSEVLSHGHPTNVPKNCNNPSNLVCECIVDFPSDCAGAIFHGVFIKRDLHSRKLFFRPKNQSLSGPFDILTKAQKNTQYLPLL